MTGYQDLTIEQLEQVRADAQAAIGAARARFRAAGKALDQKRQRGGLEEKRDDLQRQQDAVTARLETLEV